MTSSLAERKCALFLSTLRRADRRRVLRGLPADSARRIARMSKELDALGLPLAELAPDLIGDDVLGLTATTSPALDELVRLADRLSPAWYARVLWVWPNVNRAFCLSMLPTPTANAVRRELAQVHSMPPRLAAALQAEAALLCAPEATP